MEKCIFISLDLLDNANLIPDRDLTFMDFINNITVEGHQVIFYSGKYDRVNKFNQLYPQWCNLKDRSICCDNLNSIRNWLNKQPPEQLRYCIFIGTKTPHFHYAVNHKLLFIAPTWLALEEKPVKYGIKVHSLYQLTQLIHTISNQNSWFAELVLPDQTRVISLSDGRSFPCYAKTVEEREIVQLFHRILKDGCTNMYEVYLYHFLAAMSNRMHEFVHIQDWGCIPPSHNSDITKCEMYKFKEAVRNMMRGYNPRAEGFKQYPNILVRHTSIDPTHKNKNEASRIEQGATPHLQSICIHPAYKGKLKNRNVCIFDDYLTHGNSFECARNLLRHEGVASLTFVTLGRFPKSYQYQNYKFSGNLYDAGYKYDLIDRYTVNTFTENYAAKQEVKNLYDIFDLGK